MAPPATIHRVRIDLSDVDRGVYEALDFRVARHPSETLRFMLTRILAYALAYEEGIAFSKAGLHDSDEPPVAIHDPTGASPQLRVWIDVGSPAAPRLHKAAKSAKAVRIFTHSELASLRAEAASIHKASTIAVTTIAPAFLDALEGHVERQITLQLLRNEGVLYATVASGETFETPLREDTLA
jgi:uncharacterized protein YaeQ